MEIGPIIFGVCVVLLLLYQAGAFLAVIRGTRALIPTANMAPAPVDDPNAYRQSGAMQTTLWGRSFGFNSDSIMVTENRIEMFNDIGRHVLARESITEITSTWGGGLRFKHTDVSQPLTIIFRPFGFADLVDALAARHYPISAATLRDVEMLRSR